MLVENAGSSAVFLLTGLKSQLMLLLLYFRL